MSKRKLITYNFTLDELVHGHPPFPYLSWTPEAVKNMLRENGGFEETDCFENIITSFIPENSRR